MVRENSNFAPPRGQMPALQWCLLEQLRVDESYQRSIESGASQSLIHRIARGWDWALCQPLVVARREDGSLFVVDGQHRLTAARERGDINQLPCVIANYASAEEEAASFVALNQQRRPLRALEIFRAALASGDADAVLLVEMLTAAGLRLCRHDNTAALRSFEVCNIGGLRAALREYGERTSAIAMRALAQAWGAEPLRYAGTIYQGLADAVHSRRATIDETRLVAVLGGATQVEWRDAINAARAAAPGGAGWRAASLVIGRAYDGAA